MYTVENIYNNKEVTEKVKEQYKMIKKSKKNIDISTIISNIKIGMEPTNTILRCNNDEIAIKIDKKSNGDTELILVNSLIKSNIDKQIDIKMLFNIIISNNEIIVRKKRNI